MLITIEDSDWDEVLYTMAGKALRMGSKPTSTANGTVYEVYDDKLSQAEFEALLAEPVEINKAVCYVEIPYSVLDNLVDVDMPDAKYIDGEGEEVRRVYEEYAPFHTVSNDKSTVLMRCVHVQYGRTTANGTSDEEMRSWASLYPLICKTEAGAMMKEDKYVQVTD